MKRLILIPLFLLVACQKPLTNVEKYDATQVCNHAGLFSYAQYNYNSDVIAIKCGPAVFVDKRGK